MTPPTGTTVPLRGSLPAGTVPPQGHQARSCLMSARRTREAPRMLGTGTIVPLSLGNDGSAHTHAQAQAQGPG